MTSPFNTGPIAPERNPSPVPQFFQPSIYYISGITNGASTLVETGTAHNYVIGQNVRFNIPSFYGSFQLNGQQGTVVTIPTSTTFTVNIDSAFYDSFRSSPRYGPTPPQVTGIGDINTGAINQSARTNQGTTILGAFINTSPIEGTWQN